MRITFDWQRFLTQRRIEFVERGPNVARGEINIRCPWCGDADPSQHLGINLSNGYWSCRRNPRLHGGESPVRLIQALAHCSFEEAKRLAGVRTIEVEHDDSVFGDHVKLLTGGKSGGDRASQRSLELLSEFKPLSNSGRGRMFVDYLVSRGYMYEEVEELSELYDLHYATRGPFAYRIIIPVRVAGQLLSWTGRALSGRALVRYKTLSVDPDKAAASRLPVALAPTSDTLLGYDYLDSGRVLAVCEGPFDAMRVNFFGRSSGISATCLFGKGISSTQINLLDKIVDRFTKRYLLLDNDASLDALSITSVLSYLQFKVLRLPAGVKDPAELEPQQIIELF